MLDSLSILSPKRTPKDQRGWDGFFPYYAGYSENFARDLLKSANLAKETVVLDPWNGSGTTTYAASQLGLTSHGCDLNPVMMIVARARLLPPSEADAISPLAHDIAKSLRVDQRSLDATDPLLWWFDRPTASVIRSLERRIRRQLVGDRTITKDGLRLENMASLTASFYVALFSVCRQLATPYQSSNPTWLKRPRDDKRIFADRRTVLDAFTSGLESMANVLAGASNEAQNERAAVELHLADSTRTHLDKESVDLVLTSPPYCTRIDYSVATRIELALLYPLVNSKTEELGRQMIGSTRVPTRDIAPIAAWGEVCNRFLFALKNHQSKASSGYYYKTHLDYFDKLYRSIQNIEHAIKPGGAAIFVVQDSYYKEIHNDLPYITIEMFEAVGLKLKRRDNFHLRRTMAGVHRHTKTYRQFFGAVESVLCFEKATAQEYPTNTVTTSRLTETQYSLNF